MARGGPGDGSGDFEVRMPTTRVPRSVAFPMADGGEGTARALVDATGGSMRAVPVHGGPARPACRRPGFGLLADGTHRRGRDSRSQASWHCLKPKGPQPVDRLLLPAPANSCSPPSAFPEPRRIIVGLGGSATNDAGAGLLQALGVRLLDKNGNDLWHTGERPSPLTTIDISTMDPALKNVAITAACDVTNPLTGPTGASAVFGPQKVRPKMMSPHWTPPSRILRR